MADQVTVIPARCGRAVSVPAGASIEVINPSGTQVVDLWALCPPDLTERLSMEHTRVAIGRLVPQVGDTLVSSVRRPMLTMVADTSPGVHDTLMASCDTERYRLLGQARLPRQLPGQLRRGAGRRGPGRAVSTGPVQPVHERPVVPGRHAALRGAGQRAGRPRAAARGNRPDRGHVRLPARPDPGERAGPGSARSAFSRHQPPAGVITQRTRAVVGPGFAQRCGLRQPNVIESPSARSCGRSSTQTRRAPSRTTTHSSSPGWV